MPNTLAHFGIQGVLTRVLFKEVDARWLFLGSVVPDLPWILQRSVLFSFRRLDFYELRLYVIVQASLLFCLIICGFFSALTERPKKIFGILSLNCFLHLSLDALELKYANGVHLLAPFSWRLVNAGLFWPESTIVIFLSMLGVLIFVSESIRRPTVRIGFSLRGPRTVAVLVSLLVAYFLFPFLFTESVEAEDNHFVRTLRQQESRIGKLVEFDRVAYLDRQEGHFLRTFAGEELRVAGELMGRPGVVSARGVFRDENTIILHQIHQHWQGARDAASYIGLSLWRSFG
jgi:hypothetical protein